MKIKVLLLFVLGSILFSNSRLQAQNKLPQFSTEFSGDSLDGFDEQDVKTAMIMDGVSGSRLRLGLESKKRYFINQKYGIGEFAPAYNFGQNAGNSRLSSAIVNAAPCVNEGFELGSIAGWTCTSGTNFNSCSLPTTPNLVTFPNANFVTTSVTPFIDPVFSVTIPNSPFALTSTNTVVKLNDHIPSGGLTKLAQKFIVTPSNFLYQFSYYAMMASAGNHTCCGANSQPYLSVKIFDHLNNSYISCPTFTFAAPINGTNSSCSSPGITWASPVSIGGSPAYRNNGWQVYSLDLTSLINNTVSVEVIVSDCAPTGHFGYAYFDSNCGELGITLNNSTVYPAPNQFTPVKIVANCGTTATLSVPGGLGPYQWTGPGITGTLTTQSVAVSAAGNYTVRMSPIGTCSSQPFSRIINLTFAPPTSVNITPTNVCGFNTVTLSASGATNYTWTPFFGAPSNLSTYIFTPFATQVVTLTATTGTCVGTYTRQITVNPGPNISINNPNGGLCSGGGATLSATGASTYTWSPGALTGSQVVVSPTISTVFTVTGTDTNGCTGTATTNVNVNAPPAVSAFSSNPNPTPPSPPCAGLPIYLIGSGSNVSTYSWSPGGATGNFVTVTPSATTVYTLTGISNIGGCTATTTINIVVDPGPTMTVTSTPTIACPYNSTSLTALAPTALGFTWTPPGSTYGGTTSTHVVTTSVTTTYSVQGINSNGCRSTYTINRLVSPVPNITITPATSSICIGSSIVLTASGGSTYTWNPGSVINASVSLSPTTTSNYTVISSNGTCTSSATQSVQVVPLPNTNAVASPTVVCSGNSITLTGGGATTYLWAPGNFTTSVVTLTPAASTVYTVTGSSAGCSKNATVAVTVNPNPTINVVTTPTALCPGFTSTVTATGALTYTLNGLFITGVSPYRVTPPSTSVYTMSGTSSLSCVSSKVFTMVVNPTPTINLTASSNSICFGNSTNLSATGAATYTWNPGTLTGSNVSVSPTLSTVYTATGTSAAGCQGTKTINITVVPNPTVTASSSPTAICVGSSATLSAIGASSYTWSTGSTASTAVVSPTTSSIYAVTGNSNGCTNTKTVQVVVNPLPTLVATATPTSICPGFNSVLNASGGVSYTWNPGGLTGSSATVSPSSTTVYTLTGLSAQGCSATKTVQLVVKPLPTIVAAANPTSVCAGNSTTLSATGASSYIWQPGSLAGSTVIATPSASTIYTVTGTSSLGCNSSSTVNVIRVPSPTVGASASPSVTCAGNLVFLTGTGATSYTWSTGATGGPVMVSPSVTTTYSVIGLSAGCTGTAAVTVTVNPLPSLTVVATPTSVCPGGSSNLSASGAITYTWLPGSLSGANVSVTPSVTTTYTVSGSSGFGCTSSKTIQVVVKPLPVVTAAANPTSVCAGNSTSLTAGGASTYTWMPGSLAGSLVVTTPSATTIYTVTGTSSLGCNSGATVNVIRVPNPTITASSSPTAICLGGSATLTANGGTTYNWSTGATGSPIIVTPSVTTTYSVAGILAGCSGTAAVTVVVNPLPTLSVTATPTSVCPGGSSNLSAIGASTYTWLPGSLSGANVSVTPSVTTVYTVNGTSATGCNASKTIQVVVNPIPVVTAAASPTVVCAGGVVALSSGGASTYTWLPGPLSGANVTVTPSVTTVYTVSATSSLSCPGQATVLVTVLPNPTITASSSPTAICAGTTAVLTATGATSYTWNPGGLSGSAVTVTPSISTIYTITGFGGGCIGTKTISLVVNASPTVSAFANPLSICPGGTSSLTGSGATSYTWLPGGSNSTLFPVTPSVSTVYTLTGANAAGCKDTAAVQVVVNPAPVLTITPSTFTICQGGFVTLNASGATNYTWNPGGSFSSTVVAGPTVTTVYTATGTNAFGCVGVKSATVTVAPIPTISVVASTTVICPGGSATLTASGPASFTWNTGANTAAIVVSPSVTTTYSVNGISGSCSSTVAVVTVSVGTAPSLTITGNNTVCAGFGTTLTASGANSYTWNPGGSTGSNFGVTPSISTTYTLTGTNALGCTSTKTIGVQVNPNPSILASAATPTVCAGSGTSLTATGAATYTWNPGNLNGNPVFVTPSVTTTYTVAGTSSLGCNSQTNVTVFVQPNPVVTATASPASICPGGSSTLTAVGASSFVWSTTATASSIVVSPTATTIYSVAGVVGTCTSAIVTLTVVVNPLPSLTVAATPTAICPGGVSILAGTGASTYTWLPGGLNTSTISVSPAASTIYTLTGMNGFNCSSSQTLGLIVNPNPTITVSASPTVICEGQTSNLTANGATSYTWMPGSLSGSAAIVNPTVTTTYSISGSSLGCVSNTVLTLNVNPLPVITATATPASICTGNSSTLSASGGTAYSWSPIGLTGSLIAVSPTVNTAYIVTGTNNLGCTNTQTVSVTVNSVPTLTITSTSPTLCSGSSATLTGSGTLSYTWMPGNIGTSTISVNPASTSVYTLTGSNGFGCTTSMMFTLNVVPTPTITILVSNPTVCAGDPSTLTAVGATNYTWNPSGITGSIAVVNPTTNTNYTLTGDVGGCVTINTVDVFVNPLPTIVAGASPTNICNGATATLTASGASTYSWMPGTLSGVSVTVAPSVTTDYTVTATDALGCVNTQTVNLIVSPTPTVTASASATAVCIGSSITLNAGGATNYTWMPGALSGSAVVVSPSVNTIYTVTGDNGAVCSNSATFAVGVNPLPIVGAAANPTAVCAGGSLTLTASGALNYTWSPVAATGSTAVDNPTITTTYSVLGEDVNGCINTGTTNVVVNPLPTLTTVATPTAICFGSTQTVTMSTSGALSYTWSPIASNSTSITDTPTITSTYSVSGTDALGCIGNSTVSVFVVPIPTITVAPTNATVCVGFSATLTANGATNYTWLPSGGTSSTEVVTPLVTTNYTLIGDNGGGCPTTLTVDVFVNPLPANVAATCSGTITCSSPTVSLSGSTSNTNVSYSWSGPSSYTSSLQNPTGISVWGDYTLTVTDNVTGCVATATVNVPTDNSIPSVTATTSGSITCNTATVTLNAANTTTNAGYVWSGPSGFTATVQSPTASVAGVYTVVVIDLSSTCSSTAFVTVGTHTNVTITSTITPATCSAGVTNNDGSIIVAGFAALDKFDIVSGATYTGSATYTSATIIPTNSILTNNLANPVVTTTFTVRFFDAFGCIKDTTLLLVPVDCVPKILGLAKAVASTSLNADGTYNVNYKVVVKNYSSAALTNVSITENLNNSFPLPATFTLVTAPVSSSTLSGLTINSGFDGFSSSNLVVPATSSIAANGVDTLSFNVKVKTNGVFGPYKNTVTASAVDINTVTVRDSSANGLNPDPDGDNNPNNNNIPTPINFTPNLFFGLTKVGSVNKITDGNFDVSYTITVHNLGNDTLNNVSVNDLLNGATIKTPSTYSLKAGPLATGALVANTAYNGNNVIALLGAGSKMLPGTSSEITFTINVTTNTNDSLVISNSANGDAVAIISGSNVTVRDTSNTGTNPDVNGNGVWNEPVDNVATSLTLSGINTNTLVVTEPLFIPEGFSPNDDGNNDTWKIKGLPSNLDCNIIIYNRWGNRVYISSNYANSLPWDGRPNVSGTFGKDLLPQGTYFYILDIKGSGMKPKTGYVVLQY
ncbi:MAG: gliding motility-associated C-terminal domain-containing protein [Bacteroidia bacterium]|nr:gliding motility-associated C-terminal domain-containing protein [Bacteroidia bacterium]